MERLTALAGMDIKEFYWRNQQLWWVVDIKEYLLSGGYLNVLVERLTVPVSDRC